LLPTTSVLEINPDSLVLIYERLATKDLPVVLNAKIETAQQYMLSDDVLIEPSTVTVYGPTRLLNKLHEIKTEYIEI
ncbi:YbbR-like domain-containing protein, partial [bacterium]|nr:YbbR-like domain-containing protein [bacterium]